MTMQSSADCADTVRLMELARQGDAVAFGTLFERHRRSLREFVDRRLDERLRN
jgi:hypothetical protein